MATASERIVVPVTAKDKQAIVEKARRLDLPISELMRRGAFAYQPGEADEDLAAMADAAKAAAERAGAAIDGALHLIEASNQRIAQLEARAAAAARDVGGPKRLDGQGPPAITDRVRPAYVLLKLEDYYALSSTAPQSLLEIMDVPGGDFEFDPPTMADKLKPVDFG